MSDIRDAVEQYDEKKPLFGYLNFRSRKVVLKIVPEGTSRLFLGEIVLISAIDRESLGLTKNHIGSTPVSPIFDSIGHIRA